MGSSATPRSSERHDPERFLAHAARHPESQTRSKGVDRSGLVDLANAEVDHFGVLLLHRADCSCCAMAKVGP